MLSLTTIGTPSSGLQGAPCRRPASSLCGGQRSGFVERDERVEIGPLLGACEGRGFTSCSLLQLAGAEIGGAWVAVS